MTTDLLLDPARIPRVVNQKHAQYTVYIGRSGRGAFSVLGNPVIRGDLCPVCGQVHDYRGDTLPCFERYARARMETDSSYRAAILALTGQVLGCFCKPGPCHGDILIKLWGELMAPKVSYTPLFSQAQAADPTVSRVLEHYELQLQAAPAWLGDFSLKVWSTADAPSPLKLLAGRMVAKARDCVWSLPRQAETLGGYNTLYLQRYFEGQSVKPHKDPKNNRHSVLLLSLGDFDPPEHLFDGAPHRLPTGTLLHFSAWLDTLGGSWLSPAHSVGPLPRGERWALILTHNV